MSAASLIAIVLYVLITIVVLGHMTFAEVATHSDYALSAAAQTFMGTSGYLIVTAAALLATSSAINATFYGAGRLTYVIAKSGELPKELERSIRGQPLEGMFIFALLALYLVNFLPLNANRHHGQRRLPADLPGRQPGERAPGPKDREPGVDLRRRHAGLRQSLWRRLCWQVWKVPATRDHLWILVAMIVGSLALEVIYRTATKRGIHLGRKPGPDG